MQDEPIQNFRLHAVYQRYSPHATYTDPLTQRGLRDDHAGAGHGALLAVERVVVNELAHHDVSHQACSGDALVDHMRRHGCHTDGFARPAGFFFTDVALHREHPRRIVQLLTDIVTDVLHGTATLAIGRLRFMTDLHTGKIRWQLRATRYFGFRFVGRRCRMT